jgi:subtilisin family serine protease
MKRWIIVLLFVAASVLPSAAEQRFIVRDNLGAFGISLVCNLLQCTPGQSLGDPSGQLFLVTTNDLINPDSFLTLLLGQFGVVSAEVDRQMNLGGPFATSIPETLTDSSVAVYFGSPVWNGYANQPASRIVRLAETQNEFHVTGAGIVALIDTGVDTTHPALSPVLLPGYDFTNNTPDADEKGDLNHSSAAVLDGGPTDAIFVNPSTLAVVSPAAASLLGGGPYSGFGHGTMTAGIVHLVAPTAKIMPLKAFGADGTGYLSNIVRAAYYAVGHGSKVISMSFSFDSSSKELVKAVNYANSRGVICVASAGNDGDDVLVYPAALPYVMGVASTSDYDTRSSFSNYGSDVWVAAPGEGIISTYPYETYSAGWGTSFSAPFVAGTAALLVDVSGKVNQQTASQAMAHARWISNDLGNGRLDTFQAVQAWTATAESH